MLSLFSPRFLRDPSTDRPETLPHDRKLAEFYKLTSKNRGASPKKIWGQKHAKFRSILDHFRFWSRISPEWGNISKIGKTYELGKFILRLTKKVRWTLVHERLGITCEFGRTKMHFLAYYISALVGCCALKFLYALDIDQALIAHTRSGTGDIDIDLVYLAHTPTGTGVPPKNCNRTLKIWPKIQRLHVNNFRSSGSILTIFFHTTCREPRVITWLQFLEGLSPKIWKGKKTVQNFSRFLTTFEFDR